MALRCNAKETSNTWTPNTEHRGRVQFGPVEMNVFLSVWRRTSGDADPETRSIYNIYRWRCVIQEKMPVIWTTIYITNLMHRWNERVQWIACQRHSRHLRSGRFRKVHVSYAHRSALFANSHDFHKMDFVRNGRFYTNRSACSLAHAMCFCVCHSWWQAD